MRVHAGGTYSIAWWTVAKHSKKKSKIVKTVGVVKVWKLMVGGM